MKNKSKFNLRVLRSIASVTLFFVSVNWSIPVSYAREFSVEEGSVTLEEPDASTSIFNIASDKAVLRMDSFDIAASQTVNFRFANPTAASSVLNRVTGGSASSISGILLSNGMVLLVNPAGINIGSGARIETAGFIA